LIFFLIEIFIKFFLNIIKCNRCKYLLSKFLLDPLDAPFIILIILKTKIKGLVNKKKNALYFNFVKFLTVTTVIIAKIFFMMNYI